MSRSPKGRTRGPETRAELDELLVLAERVAGRDWIERGRLPVHVDYGSGTYGALRDAAEEEHDRQSVRVYRPSPLELETARVWHDYCAQHGYPTGERAGASGYPPYPHHDGLGVWVELTWTRVRSELRRREVAVVSDEQLVLQVAA